MDRPLLRVCLALLIAAGCAPGKPREASREGSLTSGHLRVAAEPDVAPLVAATARAFMRMYPEARIEVAARDSRDAMADVFANRADLAVVGREIEPVERQAASEARLDMEALHWARSGVAVVTDPQNPVGQLACDDLREVLSGRTTSWADLGGPDARIVLVVEPPERALSQYLARRLLERDDLPAPALVVADDSAAVARVARTPHALGFVSMAAVRSGVKLLAVSPTRGLPYVELDAETVYRRDYPLTRSYNLVTRTPGVALSGGFVTFACSEGQRLVRDYGLVPATVQIKFTRRPPSAPSH